MVVPLAMSGALLSPPESRRTGTAPAWRHAMTLPPERDQLFISYSHVDRQWVERLQMRYLTPAYYNKAVSESQTVAMDIAGDLN